MADQETDENLLTESPQEEQEQQAEVTTEEQESADPSLEQSEQVDTDAPEEQQSGEGEQQMSRRKAKRLEKLEGLVERLRGKPDQPEHRAEGIDYRKLIEADPAVYEQLGKASQDYGQAQYRAGLDQANSVRFHTRLEIDAPRIEGKYPQFDKGSSEFNPGLASAVNEWYLATVGYNPESDTVQNANVRYADFVEGIMDLADALAGAKTVRATENIARQAAQTGLRPDGSSAKPMNLNKAPEDMTNEELEAAVSATLPRDPRGRFTSSK